MKSYSDGRGQKKRMILGMSEHTFGTILCVSGVLILSPDTVLIRKLEYVPNFTVIFYRYAFFGAAILIFLIALRGRRSWETFCNVGTVGAIAGVVWGASNMFFTTAVQNTAVANVLVIVASNPMFASIFSWLLFREKVLLRTTLTSLACFGAIALIFSGGLSGGSESILGNMLALAASVTQGLSFALLRMRTMQLKSDDPLLLLPTNIIAGFVIAIVCLGFDVQFSAPDSTEFGYLLICGFITLGISFGLLVIGPSFIPGSEVSLFFLIETVVGPVWVFLAGYERPPAMTVYGGAMVLVALVANSVLAIREDKAMLLKEKEEEKAAAIATTAAVDWHESSMDSIDIESRGAANIDNKDDHRILQVDSSSSTGSIHVVSVAEAVGDVLLRRHRSNSISYSSGSLRGAVTMVSRGRLSNLSLPSQQERNDFSSPPSPSSAAPLSLPLPPLRSDRGGVIITSTSANAIHRADSSLKNSSSSYLNSDNINKKSLTSDHAPSPISSSSRTSAMMVPVHQGMVPLVPVPRGASSSGSQGSQESLSSSIRRRMTGSPPLQQSGTMEECEADNGGDNDAAAAESFDDEHPPMIEDSIKMK